MILSYHLDSSLLYFSMFVYQPYLLLEYFDKDSIRELVEKCTGNSPKLIEGRCSNRFIIAITQKQFHEVRH